MNIVNIVKLKNAYIIKKSKGSNFFATTEDSIIIPTFNFSALIKFMVFRELLSPKVLEGILNEWYNRFD